MIQKAYISGQIGTAIFCDDGKWCVINSDYYESVAECKASDLALFFDSDAEFDVLEGGTITFESVQEILVSKAEAHTALSLVISGMSAERSERVRKLCMEGAGPILEDSANYDFVRARLLGRCLPDAADVESAITIARALNVDRLSLLYEQLKESEVFIPEVLGAWRETAPQYLPLEDDLVAAEKCFLDAGVFADMCVALAAGDLNRLGNVVVDCGLDAHITRQVAQATKILAGLQHHLMKKLSVTPQTRERKGTPKQEPAPVEIEPMVEEDSILDLIRSYQKQPRWKVKRRYSLEQLLARINSQKEHIKNLVIQGNEGLALRHLHDLIEYNLKHGKKIHVGMSLCDLIKAAVDVSYLDFAAKLVQYAEALGVEDPVIGNTKGQVLKEKGLLANSLSAYDEVVKTFPQDVVARTGRAEVMRDLGRFEDALSAYDEVVKTFPHDVFARNGRATMLLILDRFGEILAHLSMIEPRVKQDWIAYHIVAMYYIKMNKFSEAISRLNRGCEDAPWADVRDYFKTALAVALLRQRDYEGALKYLGERISCVDFSQKEKLEAFTCHGQAGARLRDEAQKTFGKIKESRNPNIVSFADCLDKRYALTGDEEPEAEDYSETEKEIDSMELMLLLSLRLAA